MTRECYGPTIHAQKSVNALLELPASGREQDWEFELADPRRISEILSLLKTRPLEFDVQCALALLLIASVEDAKNTSHLDKETIASVRTTIGNLPQVHEAMTFYWIECDRFADKNLIRLLL